MPADEAHHFRRVRKSVGAVLGLQSPLVGGRGMREMTPGNRTRDVKCV